MIWNSKADNYSSGVTIYDPTSSTVYSDTEAKNASAVIKRRLVVRANKVGAFVKEGRDPQGKVHKMFVGLSNLACSRPLLNGTRAEGDWGLVTCKNCLACMGACVLAEKMMGGKQ